MDDSTEQRDALELGRASSGAEPVVAVGEVSWAVRVIGCRSSSELIRL